MTRFDAGEPLTDRSSTPDTVPSRTPAETEALIGQLRRLGWTSTRIAAELGLATSTVCAVLVRLGLNRLSKLEPPEPPNRYCRRHPGELVHIDVKKLARFHRPGHRVTGRGPGHYNHKPGWDAVHVAVDDTTRLAYVEILPDERGVTSVGFLRRALAFFATHGITVQRVMTDNGAPYKSRLWAAWCADHDIRHLRTRPYRPRTNGKAERFIQTMLREWAYAATYHNSAHRADVLPTWLEYYNQRRPHSALGHKPPASRLTKADQRSWDLHLAILRSYAWPRSRRLEGAPATAPYRHDDAGIGARSLETSWSRVGRRDLRFGPVPVVGQRRACA